MRNILILSGALFLGAVFFSSCSEDSAYDFDGISYERIYMQKPNTTTLGSVLKTPIGYISTFKGQISVQTTKAMASITSVTLAVDNSLVDAYNSSNSTSYETIPDGVISLSKKSLTVRAGEIVSDSTDVIISEDGYSKLTPDVSYLIPITIKEMKGSDVRLAKEAKFRSNFFVLKYVATNSLIRTEGTVSDLRGKASTDEEGQTWKCIAAENLDPQGFPALFTGSSWNRKWSLISGKEVTTASFTFDLGAMHKIGGFLVNLSVMKYCAIQLSTDNDKWTDVGDTKMATTIRDNSWKNWYAFYESIPGRYVKVSITLDPDNPNWEYAQWGYCALKELKLLLDD